ncbi:hypothetical protein FHS85_005201 [Rhodoligotrophos appendicifer]|uniref:hypothetical protein n=1 Tax=Rhodoligotrophos appendicifer TaxID=987056 RepID=UPI001960ABD0|nr:hypothetical protein [Rhodoligotrophos appendicifer]
MNRPAVHVSRRAAALSENEFAETSAGVHSEYVFKPGSPVLVPIDYAGFAVATIMALGPLSAYAVGF